MYVAVIQRYRGGHEVRKADLREVWGRMYCTRQERTMVARLELPGVSPPRHVIPPIYGAVMSCSFELIHVTGVQRDGTGMHGQHWMARRVHPSQMECALRDGNPPADLNEAIYRHWWLLLAELQGNKGNLPMAEAMAAVGILQIEYWPFTEWASATGRGYVDGKGVLVIQRQDAAPPILRGAITPAPEMRTSPPPADPMNPFADDRDGMLASTA